MFWAGLVQDCEQDWCRTERGWSYTVSRVGAMLLTWLGQCFEWGWYVLWAGVDQFCDLDWCALGLVHRCWILGKDFNFHAVSYFIFNFSFVVVSLISGPAGTGKTESVKALGHQLGRFVLVFNCDETFDFQVDQNFVSENELLFPGLRKCISVSYLAHHTFRSKDKTLVLQKHTLPFSSLNFTIVRLPNLVSVFL